MNIDNEQRLILKPGDVYFGDSCAQLETLLGSCVSLVIHDVVSKKTGMCHYMVPDKLKGKATSTDKGFYKYAPNAMKFLLEKLKGHRIPISRTSVYAVGGGTILATKTAELDEQALADSVGARNAMVAIEFMRKHFIRPREVCLGGTIHRKVVFYTLEGKLSVSRSSDSSD